MSNNLFSLNMWVLVLVDKLTYSFVSASEKGGDAFGGSRVKLDFRCCMEII